jgi:hypothetical protein
MLKLYFVDEQTGKYSENLEVPHDVLSELLLECGLVDVEQELHLSFGVCDEGDMIVSALTTIIDKVGPEKNKIITQLNEIHDKFIAEGYKPDTLEGI